MSLLKIAQSLDVLADGLSTGNFPTCEHIARRAARELRDLAETQPDVAAKRHRELLVATIVTGALANVDVRTSAYQRVESANDIVDLIINRQPPDRRIPR